MAVSNTSRQEAAEKGENLSILPGFSLRSFHALSTAICKHVCLTDLAGKLKAFPLFACTLAAIQHGLNICAFLMIVSSLFPVSVTGKGLTTYRDTGNYSRVVRLLRE
jgi:hypothetical protein